MTDVEWPHLKYFLKSIIFVILHLKCHQTF